MIPGLLRGLRLNERPDLTGLLLGIRRGAIVLILLLGYLYFKLAGEAYALVAPPMRTRACRRSCRSARRGMR